MAKPENVFRAGIRKALVKETSKKYPTFDAFPMGGTLTNGIPDDYYDGPQAPLWAEYKYIERLPKFLDLLKPTTKPHLTKLQHRFLERRHKNGHLVAVIVGCREGGVVLTNPGFWSERFETSKLVLFNRHRIVEWILQVTCDYQYYYR